MSESTGHREPGMNAQISEEAAEWFVEFRTGEPDAAMRRRFDEWMRRSPEHLRAYLEIAAIWTDGAALDARREVNVTQPDGRDNILSLWRARVATPEPVVGPGRRGHRRGFFGLAASLAGLLVAAAALLTLTAIRSPEYATGVGEQLTLRLADGSTLQLNSRTQVRVRLSEKARHVDLLTGQALFTVAKDPARVFTVRSGASRVEALGTQFDVDRRSTGTRITVLEGRVAVSLADAPPPLMQLREGKLGGAGSLSKEAILTGGALLLDAGEQVVLANQLPIQTSRVDAANTVAWTEQRLVLDAVPLVEVAELFNRYSERPIRVEDRGARPLRLSGVFATDPQFLLRYLEQRSDVSVQQTESEIRIVRR